MTRWIAAAGAFVVSLDSTVNIAFPSIAATFHVPPEAMRWVIICYVLTYAVMSFTGGAVADRVGHTRVFALGALGSALGFLLAGTAPAFGWFLAGRVVQGFAAGLVYGTAPGLTTLAVPPAQRGRALGVLGGAIGLAFTLGPLLAGVLIEWLGWRAVFHVRVPLALAVLAWALASLPPARAPAAPRLVAVRDIARVSVMHASGLSFVAHAGIFAVWLLAPFYLVERLGLDTRAGGALFMLTPLGTAVAAPFAGRVADRVGPRLPMAAGLALECAGLFLMSRVGGSTPPLLVAGALFAAGLGLGVFQVPNMAVVMAAFPAWQQGAAGGLAFLARTLGVVAGVAALAQVFAVRRGAAGFDTAFAEAFLIAALAVGAAAALAAATPRGRGDRPRSR
ncbi:MAG: MFS transporter [Candidatus Rokubacteria bacterium]|nr:MFS transporter [Candidatus Rokubacteria bacterium]